LDNEEVCNLRVISKRKMGPMGHLTRTGGNKNAYIFARKPEKKGPLRRTRRIGNDNIKIDLKETEWKAEDWIQVAEGRDWCLALVNR
jgi:hypothetical protein